jgi:gliding motility-associated protein GldM
MSGISKFTGNSFLSPITIASVFLFSCTNNSKNNLTVFKALDESLVKSNQVIKQSNQDIYHGLEEKLKDPSTSAKAGIWQPRAMQIQKLSQDMINYIDNLKTELEKEAGLTEKGSFNEADVSAVNRLFSKKGKGEELYTKLIKYKQDVFAIDLLISNTFEKTITITTNASEITEDEKKFTKTLFTEIPTIAALAMLTKFQNNVRITENKTIMFCFQQIGSFVEDFTTFSAIVGQSSKYLRAGDEVEIIAGVGAFSRIAKPEIVIKGKIIPIDETGTATVKFRASGKPGNYFVPVQISYTDQDGNKQTVSKSVEYTIAKE